MRFVELSVKTCFHFYYGTFSYVHKGTLYLIRYRQVCEIFLPFAVKCTTGVTRDIGQRSIYENANMTPKLSGHFSIFRFAFLCAQVYSGNCQTMEYIERGLFAMTILVQFSVATFSCDIFSIGCSIVLTYEPVNLAIRGSQNGHDNKAFRQKKI